MKKILYITTLSRTINAFLIPHIEMLIDKGNIVDCACCIDVPIDGLLKNRGVNIYDLPFARNPWAISNIKAFKKLIKIQEENKYDVIHVHTPIASIYGRILKLKFPNLKTIYTVHGFHFYKGAPLLNWIIYYPIEQIMSRFTDVIITMNEEDYKRALKFNVKQTYKISGVGIDLDKYNPNLFNKNKVRNELGFETNEFILLMIAEINRNKNHIQMIKAIELLNKRGVNVKVLCAGTGSLQEEISYEIVKRNLQGNIVMLGSRADIPCLINACDVGILLSHREGLPRNIMELMACKKPVIGTNIRGINDLIQNEENGILVEVNDVESTANSIEKVYNDKNYKLELGNESYKRIQKYNIISVNRQLEKIYKNI